ncbi:MAG: pyridoxal phosphate-dependent aminotransferase [Desulfotignum sp.]|nr:pyridoxal phosphate-dependent aminotransferase [Desulfotignum sp.]
MKQYDFETVYPRYDTNTTKWMEIRKYFPDGAEGIIPFSLADMELPLAPEIRDGFKAYLDRYVLGYNNATDEYKTAVCNWMKTRHNWDVKPEWMLPSNGIIHALYSSVKSYTNKGDGVIMCTPVYYPMYSAITANDRHLAECPLINRGSRYEIDFECMERLAKAPENKLLIFCSPHNPGGRVWTKEELEKVGSICLENNVIIASDEIHFDLIRPGIQHTVFAAVSQEVAANCVVMTAPSKTFNLAGLMTSNIIISDQTLRELFWEELKRDTLYPKCNALGLEACRIAYTECGEWLDQVNALIARNCDKVVDFLKREFPEVVVMDMEGTYLLWMDFSALGIESHKLAEMLRTEGKLFFDDGYIFGKAGDGFERWNLACPKKYVEEGLIRLKTVLDKHKVK